VFDPGLGQVRAGFFFSRYGVNFRAIRKRSVKSAQKQAARGIPAPGAGLIAGVRLKSRKTGLKTGRKMRDLPDFAPASAIELRHPACETNGFPGRCP
jgi:hypothetical protein